MENSFGLFISLFLGLFSLIRFKQLGKFVHKQGKNIPSIIPSGLDILILQGMFLVIGSLFFIVSLTKLILLTGVQTSNNLLDWSLAFWGLYIIISFKQISKYMKKFRSKKDFDSKNISNSQIVLIVIGIGLFIIGLIKIFVV